MEHQSEAVVRQETSSVLDPDRTPDPGLISAVNVPPMPGGGGDGSLWRWRRRWRTEVEGSWG